MNEGGQVLALNGGSSSLKFGLYRWAAAGPEVVVHGEAQGIGAGTPGQQAASQLRFEDAGGALLHSSDEPFKDVQEAATAVLDQLAPRLDALAAIAHRIVHGGPDVQKHQRLTPAVRAQLGAAADFAPLHVPPALAVVDAAAKRFPAVPQIACLDTAFHRTLPARARRFPLPEETLAGGVHRFGAHGLSLESAVRLLGKDLKPRCVIAHLGGGCSVTAVENGRSVDTTMGLTPTGGMMMGTRTGDLDPGVLIYLLRHRGYTPDTLEELVNRRSGLLGVSGQTADLRKLTQDAQEGEANASLALEMFNYQAAQAVAKMSVALGGLDQLIFTGGIGERSAETRAAIGWALGFLGVKLETSANDAGRLHPAPISSPASAIEVRIVPAQEEWRMAGIAAELLT